MTDILDLFPNDQGSYTLNRKPTAQDAIGCLVQCGGNIHLAVEALSRNFGLQGDDRLTVGQMVKLCSEDFPTLQRAVRSSMTIELYAMIDTALSIAASHLPNLEPTDAIRAAVQLSTLLTNLTDNKRTELDINVKEYAYGQLDHSTKQILAQLQVLEEQAADMQS